MFCPLFLLILLELFFFCLLPPSWAFLQLFGLAAVPLFGLLVVVAVPLVPLFEGVVVPLVPLFGLMLVIVVLLTCRIQRQAGN